MSFGPHDYLAHILKVDDAFKATHPGLPWRDMAAMTLRQLLARE